MHIILLWLTPTSSFFIFFPCTLFFFSLSPKLHRKNLKIKHPHFINTWQYSLLCAIFNFFFWSNEKTIGIDWYRDNKIYTLHWYHWYIDIYMNTSFHLINQHTEKKNHMMKKKFSKMAEVSHMTLTTCTNHKSR